MIVSDMGILIDSALTFFVVSGNSVFTSCFSCVLTSCLTSLTGSVVLLPDVEDEAELDGAEVPFLIFAARSRSTFSILSN